MEERVRAHERQASWTMVAAVIAVVLFAAAALIAALSSTDEIAGSTLVQQILAEFPEAKDLPSET